MSTIGHNSGTVINPDTAKQLKSIVERVEKLAEEKDAITSDIRDVYEEAKGNGYDTKALRVVIARRKMERQKREELDALVETYEGVFS